MIKILELFGGIGACSSALTKLGIEYEIADYVEIDKYAVKSYNAIHGTNFEPQDITTWNKDVEVDLIMHGSPCQDFSLAGKQVGGDKDSGTRSSLMYETIRIVEKLKPKYVIWENVKNLLSKKHRHNFDAYLETMEQLGYTNYYQVLNAKDYGIPQNRERVFTVSILGNESYEFPKVEENTNKIIEHNPKGKHQQDLIQDEEGLCRCIPAGTHGSTPHLLKTLVRNYEFPPKQPLKLKLKDMLEDEVDEKYYLSEQQIENIKKSTFHQNNRRIQEKEYCDTLCARDWKDPKCVQVATLPYFSYESDGRVYSPSGISPCLRAKEPNQKIDEDDKIIIASTQEHATISTDGVVPTLTSAMGQGGGHVPMHNYDLRIRKLTPKECWRLMGFDDEDYEKASQFNSNTQLYKQAGNSIVVNVLMAIFKELIK